MILEHLKHTWAELVAPGAGFAVSEADVRGMNMKVFTAAPPNVRVLWEMIAANATGDYLVYEDERLSYPEAAALVRSLAHHLHDRHGIGPGDRVAIAMRNYPEWVISYWAILSLGAAAVGMNAWWTAPEMEYALKDSAPKVFIGDDERIERLLPSIASFPDMAVIAVRAAKPLPAGAVRWEDVIRAEGAPDTLPPADIHPDDDACIFYTSGTTGFPKGAQLTHRGCVTNVLHMAFWAAASGSAIARETAEASGQAPAAAAPGRSVTMAPTPLFHVTANNCLLYAVTLAGGTLVLTYKWDPARALELIEREKVTSFSGVPTMSRELMAHPDWAVRDTSTLTAMGGGGAALQPDLVEKIDKTLEKGVPSTGYGLTETHGIVTANGAAFFLLKPRSCGPAMPTFDVKLVDEEGNEVPKGQRGALCVRGPAVIKGYLNRDASVDLPDGWFNTGDVAEIDDDGFVYIVDRIKDMVIRGGENVYCSEVEATIYTHPGVAEAVVFGIPDERLGEEVAAAVVPTAGHTLTEQEIRDHVGAHLAKHKVPAKVWVLDEPLPRNANGKFVKRDLKAKLLGTA